MIIKLRGKLLLLNLLGFVLLACSHSPSLFSTVAVNQRYDGLEEHSELSEAEPTSINISYALTPRKLKRNLAKSLWEFYNAKLDQYPLLTKMATGTVCGFLGDLIYQLWREYKYNIPVNINRMAMFVIVTCFYHAPALHWWFDFSDKKGALIHNKGMRISALMFTDNFMLSPILNPVFIFLAALLCTPNIFGTPLVDTFSGALGQMKEEAWSVNCKCWKLWPVVHFF
mmetsp:Transcript_15573/g.22894  ORF Transcript_15573/g.22894 Transcript_15573/m.22894 type:complete len:227 (+) Transcript_15573:117-797(+)